MSILRALHDDRGLTLVEMMVGLVMGSIALAVIFSIFVSTQSSYSNTREFVDNQADSRVILGMIAQEIRSAGSDYQRIGLERLTSCTGDTVSFQSDLNSDGVISITEPAESVMYFFDGGAKTLFRDVGEGALPVLQNIESLAFNFLDVDGNVLARPLSTEDRRRVKAVQIDVEVVLNELTTRAYSSVVALRNEPTTF